MNYFVITDAQNLIASTSFALALQSHWPTALVEEVRDPASSHTLRFSIPMGHASVTGSLNREGCSIVFIGDMRDCATFALWCRGLLPPNEPATFCDEGMSGSVDLTPATTLDDLLQAFGHRDFGA